MIKSFRSPATERLFKREPVRQFQAIEQSARRKLAMLHAAKALDDLKTPPGNRLEKLHGNREGQYSVRINDQWRVCFEWRTSDVYEVEIVDYR